MEKPTLLIVDYHGIPMVMSIKTLSMNAFKHMREYRPTEDDKYQSMIDYYATGE